MKKLVLEVVKASVMFLQDVGGLRTIQTPVGEFILIN